MVSRVLISTFGFDETKVLRALRWLPYDSLVLVAGGKSLREPGLRRLRAAERASGGTVELVSVDPFDFPSCFQGTLGAIERHRKAGAEVRVNVSGGTKVLADAALLASFQAGVEAWHCEDRPLRLPVLRGVTLTDDLTPVRKAVLAAVGRPRPATKVTDRVRLEGFSEAAAQAAINWLRSREFVAVEVRGGVAIVSRNPRTAWFVRSVL